MGLTNKELEEESGCKINSQHECERNDLPENLRILNIVLEGEGSQSGWEFFSIWLANDADVAGGEAEENGELMNLSSVRINFCPFCGEQLEIST
jgi:hypothetical protein